MKQIGNNQAIFTTNLTLARLVVSKAAISKDSIRAMHLILSTSSLWSPTSKRSSTYNKMINMFPSRSILKYMNLSSNSLWWVRPRLLKILSIFLVPASRLLMLVQTHILPSWAYRIDAPFWPPTNAPWKMNGKWLKNNFYWVPVPLLTMVITSIPFFLYLPINNQLLTQHFLIDPHQLGSQRLELSKVEIYTSFFQHL